MAPYQRQKDLFFGGGVPEGLAPVRDRYIAKVLAIIADHYDALGSDYARDHFIRDFKNRYASLFVAGRGAPGSRLADH